MKVLILAYNVFGLLAQRKERKLLTTFKSFTLTQSWNSFCKSCACWAIVKSSTCKNQWRRGSCHYAVMITVSGAKGDSGTDPITVFRWRRRTHAIGSEYSNAARKLFIWAYNNNKSRTDEDGEQRRTASDHRRWKWFRWVEPAGDFFLLLRRMLYRSLLVRSEDISKRKKCPQQSKQIFRRQFNVVILFIPAS